MEGKEVIVKKVKKNVHGGGHGGSSWKVAYADFVTAMMAFFLLMWLLTAMKPKDKEKIALYFSKYSIIKGIPEELLKPKEVSEQDVKYLQQILKEKSKNNETRHDAMGIVEKGISSGEELMQFMQSEIKLRLSDVQDQILVDVFEGAVRIQLVDKEGKPLFESGSAVLTQTGKDILKVITDRIKTTDVRIAIEGHTDAHLYSASGKSNWELSTERALTTRREVVNDGFNPDALVRISGYAATNPINGENPYDLRNRRINLLLYYK